MAGLMTVVDSLTPSLKKSLAERVRTYPHRAPPTFSSVPISTSAHIWGAHHSNCDGIEAHLRYARALGWFYAKEQPKDAMSQLIIAKMALLGESGEDKPLKDFKRNLNIWLLKP